VYYCSTERTRDGETTLSGGRDTKAVREHLTGRLFSTRKTRIIIIITIIIIIILRDEGRTTPVLQRLSRDALTRLTAAAALLYYYYYYDDVLLLLLSRTHVDPATVKHIHFVTL